MLIAFCVLTAVALLAAIIARRGRLVGKHVHCRRCKFDLHGLPETVSRCPECGSEIDLVSSRNVQRGLRRRRGWLVAVTVLLVLLTATPTAVLVVARRQSINLYTYAPTWWLLSLEGDAGALDELTRRDGASPLSALHRWKVVELLLAAQADRNQQWNLAWGDWIEQSHAADAVQWRQWEAYLLGSMPVVSLETRGTLSRGRSVPVKIGAGSVRGGSKKYVLVSVTSRGLWIDEHTIRPQFGGRLIVTGTGNGSMTSVQPAEVLDGVSLGKHTLSTRVTTSIQFPQKINTPIVEKTSVVVAADFDLVEASATQQSEDPELKRKAIQESIESVSISSSGPASWFVYTKVASAPCDLGFDVFAKIDGKERLISTLAIPEGGNDTRGMGFMPPAEMQGTASVELIFRGSRKAADSSLLTNDPWMGEIMILNVKIVPVGGSSVDETPQFAVPATRPSAS